MLTGVHLLLTYRCTFECDHCFLYCGPSAAGTFTLAQVEALLEQAGDVGTVEEIYFEGGEPFLFHPLLVAAVGRAKRRGFSTGVVTNAYWATEAEDIALWLAPLAAAGLDRLSVSDDAFHNDPAEEGPARRVAAAAKGLGIPASSICIEAPTVAPAEGARGAPVVGGGALFKGRAADKLVAGLPRRPPESFDACLHEELATPRRVHIDPFGHVQICQGIRIGNLWREPLSAIVAGYDAAAHPICGPLVRGGPPELARAHGVALDDTYVDACHLCFTVRRALLDRLGDQLAPRQVYGPLVPPTK